MLKKLPAYLVIVVLALLLLTSFLAYLYLKTGSPDSSRVRFNVASSIPDYNPKLIKESSAGLEEYLEKIEFWKGGVVSYNADKNPTSYEVNELNIEFVPTWQEYLKVSRPGGVKVFSSNFQVENGIARLYVFVNPDETKIDGVERYVLMALFQRSDHTKRTYSKGSEKYNEERSTYIERYIDEVGHFLEL